MAKATAALGVHLLDTARGAVQTGHLTRAAAGGVVFNVAEDYLGNAARPILNPRG